MNNTDLSKNNVNPDIREKANTRMITQIMLRLLPVQILLIAVGSINGIVSGLFATNSIGDYAMSIVALYAPFGMLVGAIGTMLAGGVTILAGKSMGRGDFDKLRELFSIDIAGAVLLGVVVTAGVLAMGIFGLTGFFTTDPLVQPLFNVFLIGQSIGILPQLLGNQLAAFLSLENNLRRATAASIVCIGMNVLLCFLFIQILNMGIFGLALASALGLWSYFLVAAQYFLSSKTKTRFTLRALKNFREFGSIAFVGAPGSLTFGYQMIRGLIVNKLLIIYVGSIGLSAFGAANNFLALFWSIPVGMAAVSRMMFSVSYGEEDRQTVTDIMRVMARLFLPIQCVVSALLIVCAIPMTSLFYQDPADPVYMMTVWGFRLLPLCMPLSLIGLHFMCFDQTSGQWFMAHLLSFLDGVACVAAFSAILIPFSGIFGLYIANILNGIVVILAAWIYSIARNRHVPRSISELLVIPDSFGVPESQRLDLSARSLDDVEDISQKVMTFCHGLGIDDRRSYLAGLCLEEMASNVVRHGFEKSRGLNSIDIRVLLKGDDLILRVKDDCVEFNPLARKEVDDNSADPFSNIGIRLVLSTARDVNYQSILGMNVLTILI